MWWKDEEDEGHEPSAFFIEGTLKFLKICDFFIEINFVQVVWFWMNLLNLQAMITLDGANSIFIFVAFQSFNFGARWVRALEVRARYFPILTEKFIFSGEKFRKKSCKLIKLQLKFKRAHPTRAKIKAMKSYKNLDAICTMKHDHSSKIEQIHPNRTTCMRSILILKKHVFFLNLPSITNSKGQGPLLLLPSIPISFFNISASQWNYESSH